MAQVSSEEKTMTLALLECFRQYRCLWDMRNEHYANRDRRNEAYNALLGIYKTAHPDATVSTLKKKLENMRTAYKREEKKVSASETTGAASDQVYVPKLWYYQNLNFLSEKPQVSCGTETLEEEGETIDTPRTDVCEPGEEPPPTSTDSTPTVLPPAVEGPPKKKCRKSLDKKKEEMIDAVQALLSTQESECDIIGRSLGIQLQKLEATQRAIAEKLFAEVIFYGKMNKLTPLSSINLYPSQQIHFQYPMRPQHSPSSVSPTFTQYSSDPRTPSPSTSSTQRPQTPQTTPIPQHIPLHTPFQNPQQLLVTEEFQHDSTLQYQNML